MPNNELDIYSPRNDELLANAAILYYKEGLTQSDVAKRMGLSRATVVSYLRLARENNIVDIRINGSPFSSTKLARSLKERFALEDAYVAELGPDPDESPRKRVGKLAEHVIRVGAAALYTILRPGDILGVAWGETVHHLSLELSQGRIEGLTVCQMIGSMKSPLVSSAEGSAIRIAARLSAECNTLHAPAILSSKELAAALRAEPTIESQLAMFSRFTRSLFSVGNCGKNTHVIRNGIATLEDLAWYRSRGAVGILCARFIDSEGNHIEGPLDARMISMPLELLREQRSGILVASGSDKFEATMATLRGGYVSHLIVDNELAQRLVSS